MGNPALKLPPTPTPTPTPRLRRVSGLSGNEVYCLKKLGLSPGNICIGNSVYSLGMLGGLKAGLKTLAGGEIPEITSLILEGRNNAFLRMMEEARKSGGLGVTGVTNELRLMAGNIEFLSIGSTMHQPDAATEKLSFSTSASAQELYCQLDAGFQPKQFVFGNVAYSIGLGGGIMGSLRSLGRGEVKEFSEIFDHTRRLALGRITKEAMQSKANCVLGIETTITPLMGAQEMLMTGTASHHDALAAFDKNPATSDLTNEELWSMVNIGYVPLRLVMGVSVYSLGFAGSLMAAFRSFVRGEVSTVTELLYEARELALERVQRDAAHWGADEVVGVKTHVYDLGNGLIEFLAIGTAVKKVEGVTTKHPQMLPQTIIRDRDTYFEGQGMDVQTSRRAMASASNTQKGPLAIVGVLVPIFLYGLGAILGIFNGAHEHQNHGRARQDAASVSAPPSVSAPAPAVSNAAGIGPSIEMGDRAAVEAYLNQGGDANAVFGNGASLLMIAAKAGQAPIVELLLAHGASIDAVDASGATALVYGGVFGGHADVTLALLNHNANLAIKNKNEWDALMGAVDYGRVDVVRALIEHKADVNTGTGMGSVLDLARERGNKDVIELLEHAGAQSKRSAAAALK